MKFVSCIGAGLMAAAFACISGGALAAEDATTFMLNPAHDGNIKLKGFNPPLKLKWSRDLGGNVTYPLIANGRIYVTTDRNPDNGNGSTVYALDLHNGDILWQQGIGGTYNNATMTYDHGQVFALDDAGHLYGFDGETGTPGLNIHLGDEYSTNEPPVADRGTIYASEQGVYAIDEETGAEKWHQFYSWGTFPALGGKNLFTENGSWLYSTSQKGKTNWHQTDTGGAPAFYKGRIYTTYGNVIDAGTSEVVTTLPPVDRLMAFWSDKTTDYRLGISNGQLSAIDVNTGTVAWTFSGDSTLITAPIVINDRIAVGSSAGTLYLVDAATGTQRWSQTVPAGISATGWIPWISMAAGDGALAVPGGNSLTVFVSGKKN